MAQDHLFFQHTYCPCFHQRSCLRSGRGLGLKADSGSWPDASACLRVPVEEWGVPLATLERFRMAVRGELNLLEFRRPEETLEAAQAHGIWRPKHQIMPWRKEEAKGCVGPGDMTTFMSHVLPDIKESPNTVGDTPKTAHGLSPTRRGHWYRLQADCRDSRIDPVRRGLWTGFSTCEAVKPKA